MSSDLVEHSVIFSPDDVYVIITPRGEEIHVTKMLALAIQYALITGKDVVDPADRRMVYGWLDDHAVQPYVTELANGIAVVNADTPDELNAVLAIALEEG